MTDYSYPERSESDYYKEENPVPKELDKSSAILPSTAYGS